MVPFSGTFTIAMVKSSGVKHGFSFESPTVKSGTTGSSIC